MTYSLFTFRGFGWKYMNDFKCPILVHQRKRLGKCNQNKIRNEMHEGPQKTGGKSGDSIEYPTFLVPEKNLSSKEWTLFFRWKYLLSRFVVNKQYRRVMARRLQDGEPWLRVTNYFFKSVALRIEGEWTLNRLVFNKVNLKAYAKTRAIYSYCTSQGLTKRGKGAREKVEVGFGFATIRDKKLLYGWTYILQNLLKKNGHYLRLPSLSSLYLPIVQSRHLFLGQCFQCYYFHNKDNLLQIL